MTVHQHLPGKALTVCVLTVLSLALPACEGPMSTGQKTMAGAAAGAAAGGLLTGHGRGALLGAGAGAIAGALIGHAQTEERQDGYGGGRYPFARPSDRYGLVYSPYPPHALIDVRGIPSGGRVVDPSTDRVFINP